MKKIFLSACLWDANDKSEKFSRCYDEKWALKLYRMWHRNLTIPHRFVLFTDRQRKLPEEITQIVRPNLGKNGYGDCVVPFKIEEPMIFTGLDTLIVGNCDKFARWCFEADKIALPKHPNEDFSINGVVLKPQGHTEIFEEWRGENDMDWMRKWPHDRIDNLWPDRVVSYKKAVRDPRLFMLARIIYFHGQPKMHNLSHIELVRQNWR